MYYYLENRSNEHKLLIIVNISSWKFGNTENTTIYSRRAKRLYGYA